jgi:hypothetical protein
MVDLGQLLSHHGQLILDGAQGRLRLGGQAVHDFDVVAQVGYGAVLSLQLVPQAGQLRLHAAHRVKGGLVLEAEVFEVLPQQLQLPHSLSLPGLVSGQQMRNILAKGTEVSVRFYDNFNVKLRTVMQRN